MVELLDLSKGRVGQSGDQSEGFINSGGGLVVFGNQSFEFLVLLLSNEVSLSEGLSVLNLVLLQVLNLLLKLSSSGLQQVVDGILGSVDVNDGILDVLLEGDNEGVVFVGSDTELEFELVKLIVHFLDHFLDGTNEVLEDTSGKGVELNHGKEGLSELTLLEVLVVLHGVSGETFGLKSDCAES